MGYLLFSGKVVRRRRLAERRRMGSLILVHKDAVQGFSVRLAVLFARSFAVARFPYTWNNATTFQHFGKILGSNAESVARPDGAMTRELFGNGVTPLAAVAILGFGVGKAGGGRKR
jgi:hypothetical protein